VAPILLLLVSALGCHRAPPPTGEVSGRVTVAGVPIQFGAIAFIAENGQVATAPVKQGAYQAHAVPVGAADVTVQAVRLGLHPVGSPKFGPLPSGGPPLGEFVPVPSRYNSPKTSGLQYQVIAGEQTKDFDLEAK
jgi:hypothetical protein